MILEKEGIKTEKIPFPEEFKHMKSYVIDGVKHINANYLTVSELESRRNRRSRAISSAESGGASLSVSYSSPVGADILDGTA